MTAVIQRVNNANVTIDGKIFSEINNGLLVLLGIHKTDKEEDTLHLAKKIIDLRIFNDSDDKMNMNVKDIDGEILVISQFRI